MDRNCLSYWFPKLQSAGLPVPRTEIVRTEIDLTLLLDGKTPDGWESFITELQNAADKIGPCPWFFRTGLTSGKHDWRNTCFIGYPGELEGHVWKLVEFSHLVDFFGLSHDVWCIREMLPTTPLASLGRYGGMSLVSELRCFIRGGEIVCCHPYWPEQSILEGLEPEMPAKLPPGKVIDAAQWLRSGLHSENDRKKASDLFAASQVPIDQTPQVHGLAKRVAEAFADDGDWSVDLLQTSRGWFVTDMAEAHRSFHLPDCQESKRMVPGP